MDYKAAGHSGLEARGISACRELDITPVADVRRTGGEGYPAGIGFSPDLVAVVSLKGSRLS